MWRGTATSRGMGRLHAQLYLMVVVLAEGRRVIE